jgi:hypothetical protein
MARRTIRVVTFNRNEEAAVSVLFDELLMRGPWQSIRGAVGARRVQRSYGRDEWQLEHVPLKAQGNVLAAVHLADFFANRTTTDSIVFYGCAGALRPADTRSVFLVESAQYLSLGKVRPAQSASTELVTLNNKWLCHTSPASHEAPLAPVVFPLCSPGGASMLDLVKLTQLPVARVAATDKVIAVSPSPPPSPAISGMAGNEYHPDQWTYGAALGLMEATSPNPVIVDMESYGIGRLAHALSLQEFVVILRVTTDALTDHARSDSEQEQLLLDGRLVLAHLLRHLFVGLTSII